MPERGFANYCAIFGSLPGENVKAKSDLAVQFRQLMLKGGLNIRKEVPIPEHFTKFKGSNNKSTVQNETQSYALGFGQQSESDRRYLRLFQEYAARMAGEEFEGKDPRPYFEIIQDFNEIVEVYDKQFTWDKVDAQNENSCKSTVLVYGECGQGKSTTLNQIVDHLASLDGPSSKLSLQFVSNKSFKSVTGCFKEGTFGQMSLMDTPGLNDPNAERSDKSIIIEMMKNLEAKLKDKEQGITSLILCVLPDAS